MARILLALPVVFVPVVGSAQDGPSFDCGYATTRTELAICASPELSQLERRMVQSYEAFAAASGEREARSVADDLLERRQACEGDTNCIAERLVISMEVFDQRSGRQTESQSQFARLEDILPGAPAGDRPFVAAPPVVVDPPAVTAAPPVAAAEPPVVAAAPPAPAAPPVAAEPGSDLPLAAQAPWPPEISPVARGELSDAIDGAELASSDGAVGAAPTIPVADPDGAAAFDTPLSWAFMDLEREQRASVQERLAQAGFLQGHTDGTWTNGTLAALQDLARQEGSGSFDLTTETGASLLLDYVSSEAFATAFRVEEAAATPVATAPAQRPTVVDTGDPLAGTDW